MWSNHVYVPLKICYGAKWWVCLYKRAIIFIGSLEKKGEIHGRLWNGIEVKNSKSSSCILSIRSVFFFFWNWHLACGNANQQNIITIVLVQKVTEWKKPEIYQFAYLKWAVACYALGFWNQAKIKYYVLNCKRDERKEKNTNLNSTTKNSIHLWHTD